MPRDKHDEIVAAVGAMMSNVPYGDPSNPPKIYMGPVINERQREKIHGMVQRAVEEGATLVTGGETVDPPGWFYKPTLLANVDPPDSEIAQEEVFGPVLAVIPPFDDDDHAVRIANNSIYGLSGGVLSATTTAQPRSAAGSVPARSASTAETTSPPPRCRSADTSSPASAARWASRACTSSSRSSPSRRS